ncbi:MAG: serine hydrolase domain-containing protein [Bacteroidia bacterium]
MKSQKSNNTLRIALALIIFLFLFVSCTKDLYYVHGTVQEEMNKAVDGGFDGMIVYVNQGGKSYYYSAGYDDREKQTPANPHALFKIASISKLYMAAAAAMLVADQKLSLESTLAELLPETEGKIPYANEITLKLMIKHRSGILDYGFESEVPDETFDDYMSFAARVYDKEAAFKPDNKYGYSNSNYLLLGEIMDRTLGYSHQDYIQTEILDPLGLINTYKDYKDSDTSSIMKGYLIDWEPHLRAWDFPLPGGNMVATAEDVGTFLRALIDGTLLTDKEQEIYTSIYEYEHTGWLPGYTSIARYHSDIDAVVVQFVNTSGKEVLWLKLRRVYNRIVRCIEKEKLQ